MKRKHKESSKHKSKRRKRRSSSSSSSTESSTDSTSSSSSNSYKKHKRKQKEEVKAKASTSTENKGKYSKKKELYKKTQKSKDNLKPNEVNDDDDDDDEGNTFDVPLELMEKSKSMAPMTKEEWDKRQNVIRKVYDETTGRHRLIKGDGEVIEEIVSKERHKAINAQATKGDGDYFQSVLNSNK